MTSTPEIRTPDPRPRPAGPVPSEPRAARFERELAELKIPDPAAGRTALWARLGGVLMALGIVLGIVGYLTAHTATDALVQRDALALGLGGIASSVVGSALFLRYSLTHFLRFWMARQSFDLAQLADRLHEKEAQHGSEPR
ncbi:hypothetical protein [Actinocorallia longicatena]|uniref:Uncharacterized protein n=1 Tax=Actinocorallia longicatena TaxID=111803 RepID=A0ABP6Q5G5_9ACTN